MGKKSVDLPIWLKLGRVQNVNGTWTVPQTSRELIGVAKKAVVDDLVNPDEKSRAQSRIQSTDFTKIAEAPVATARGLLGGVAGDLTKNIGLPPGMAGSLMSTAQAVVTGDISSALTTGAGALASLALAPVLGPFAPLAGGLLAMGLGSLFGSDDPPEPLPAKKDRKFTRKKPEEITLAWVLEEVWLTSVRWHTGNWFPNGAQRALDFSYHNPSGAGGGASTNIIVMPSGHTAKWRIAQNGRTLTTIDPRKMPVGADGKNGNIGLPFDYVDEENGHNYIMGIDALAEFCAYNPNTAVAVQERLAHHFSSFDKKPTKAMEPFTPYFSTVGWIEYIAAAAILEARARGLYTATDLSYTDSKQIRAACKKLMAPYEPKNQKTKIVDLSRFAYPKQSAIGALALVTHEVVATAALGPYLTRSANAATIAAKKASEEFQKFVRDQLLAIGASTGRIEEAQKKSDERAERIESMLLAKSGFNMAGGWPIAVGALALAGGMWWMNRRPMR